MQTTTVTTPETAETATSNVNQESTSHVDQQENQSNKQEDSFIRLLYPRSKWSDRMELLGCIFLTIIIYVVSCELYKFGKQYLLNTPSDVFLYRYQCMLCFIMFIISYCTVYILTICIIFVLMFTAESIFLGCVKYYYVEGRNSYKWWQKKTNIELIINCIMLLIWFLIVIELGNIIFTGAKAMEPTEDRFSIYRFSGFAGIVYSALFMLFNMVASKNKSICPFIIPNEFKKILFQK